ncbi:MAG: carnitine 3-dehydrogenase, partial [Pseudomonadota bacterium]
MSDVKRAAILGGGVIGGGWLARLIENGVECRVFDPDPEAERKLGAVLENAERAYAKLTMAPRPQKADWAMAATVAEAAE